FIVILVSAIGGAITDGGMAWYDTIILPSFTPAGSVIGAVWTIIFALCIASAIIIWSIQPHDKSFRLIILLFLINAFLNVFWSALFFGWHLIGFAFVEAILLDLSVIALIILIWPKSRLSASLLIPYAFWVAFASFLTFTIWQLNS
ncbi:MAG: TspO/MBR family protein, partial [Patescibacteria group bacterium]